MIKLDHVFKNFGPQKNAVNDLSLEVADGETLVLLGTSGCGKTTTLRMINRLLEPDSGHIYVNGKEIRQLAPETLRRNIGYVLQNTGLFPHYTVSENIAIVPSLLQWDKATIQQRVITLMDKLHLPPVEYADAWPQQLSGGQQQRVGLARALAANPPVLLMDEPFGALDPLTRISVRREFKALDELSNRTIILVTHDVEEAFELGSRICLMNEGTIQQLGTPLELLRRPANEFVAAFLAPQRLLLELKTLKIKDLWPWLPHQHGPGHTTALSADQNCWEAMEAVISQPVLVQYAQEQKILDGSGLMQAIAAWKN
ncbi:ATP-binding cassette domain-containing protein [Chitinophaga polysaccharea]|uniref:ABC transporter ATP-binding protein n=1 Tax=Chitinophaga TaxID=79328 RepID=UPI0014555A48|nr:MULTISPECIES: ATP-binding cassette domain-containing protein [Chitinophaga]NLR58428.1 ATP-binding cassette domain-containing protein [Chitinophaga polysaccharea]NLU90956.1 ATP-binding cassette domain-containing protein [Chitinophaga sp. Ak27]